VVVVVVVVVVVYASDIWHTFSPVFKKSSSELEWKCLSLQDVLSGYNQKSPIVFGNAAVSSCHLNSAASSGI
jgi:hypothetical protein